MPIMKRCQNMIPLLDVLKDERMPTPPLNDCNTSKVNSPRSESRCRYYRYCSRCFYLLEANKGVTDNPEWIQYVKIMWWTTKTVLARGPYSENFSSESLSAH